MLAVHIHKSIAKEAFSAEKVRNDNVEVHLSNTAREEIIFKLAAELRFTFS